MVNTTVETIRSRKIKIIFRCKYFSPIFIAPSLFHLMDAFYAPFSRYTRNSDDLGTSAAIIRATFIVDNIIRDPFPHKNNCSLARLEKKKRDKKGEKNNRYYFF